MSTRTPARRAFFIPLIFILICGLGVALLFSQQTRPAPSPSVAAVPADSTPTFKSSSRLVVVDVVVTDRDGNPITGLDEGDFTVLEDGKVQVLQAFEPHVQVKQTTTALDIQLPLGSLRISLSRPQTAPSTSSFSTF